MDTQNVGSWVLQPNVCRCCLSSNGVWDLTASYSINENEIEVFGTMFVECFGLSVSEHNYCLNYKTIQSG